MNRGIIIVTQSLVCCNASAQKENYGMAAIQMEELTFNTLSPTAAALYDGERG